MVRPNVLKNPITTSLILEKEQIEKLNKLCGNGNVSEYIRQLIENDSGNIKPYLEMIKSQETIIKNKDDYIETLQSIINKLQGENLRNKILNEPKQKKLNEPKITSHLVKCQECGTENVVMFAHGKRPCLKCGKKIEY